LSTPGRQIFEEREILFMRRLMEEPFYILKPGTPAVIKSNGVD